MLISDNENNILYECFGLMGIDTNGSKANVEIK